MRSWILTISSHGSHIRTIHNTLVLLRQRFYVALTQIQDLLPQDGAVLMAGPLLDGEVQQHHAPDEAEAYQEEAKLLRWQLPHEGRGHAGWSAATLTWPKKDSGAREEDQDSSGGMALLVSVAAAVALSRASQTTTTCLTSWTSFLGPSSFLRNISEGLIRLLASFCTKKKERRETRDERSAC